MSHPITRRRFNTVLAAAPALAAAQTAAPPAAPPPRAGTLADAPPFRGPIEFVRKDIALKAEAFPMPQVHLHPSRFLDARNANMAYLSRLPIDKLLYNFRQNAGIATGAVAEPFTGWESSADGKHDTELRGHFTGHFLSASALAYAATGDLNVKAKADTLVEELAKCQQKLGSGYLSAFPTELFDRLDALGNKPGHPWAPFYTIHKIMAGMLDMHQLAGNRQALEVVESMAGWADTWSASKTEPHMQEILDVEFGGIAETLYNLAAVTGNDQWARTGDRFSKKRFLNPLAERRDELRGLHANTHIPQVIAAARRYEISGDTRFGDAADFFWHEVTGARAYVTGGTSNNEGWLTPPRMLAAELSRGTATAECCCAYNMMKLTRHLYSWTANPAYFDYYERALLNHRLGAIDPQTGHTQYYLSLTSGAWRTFNSEQSSFWCCTGTGVEEFAKLTDSIYWRDRDGLYINLFIASELAWPEKGLTVRQDTHFPDQQSTRITVRAEKPVALALRLRVPRWLRSAPQVKLNGRPLEVSATPGSYLSITRTWSTGDRVEMELPMHLSVEAMPDNPALQAFLYGPLVLAGDLGAAGLTSEMLEGEEGPSPDRHPINIPTLHAAADDPAAWIEPVDRNGTFRVKGQGSEITLAPLNTIFGRRYVVYWQVT